ncbi:MAG: SET domain-containing protein-lysine N-methyltransferase [Paraburkholderia sp.]|jgi:SET domain-containing protein|nr:SET domain-containing protein-lysine N-methyltransferase [Paraburkholderia sp.]
MKRVTVRQSPVHGKGVFALLAMRAGERIFEYKGMVTTWREAARWNARRGHSDHADHSGHTFLFGLADGRVIDGGRGGNGARWLNHACAANCEAIEDNGRIFIEAIRDIAPGEELFIDYALELEIGQQAADDAQRDYACRCGAPLCRGTMLGQVAASALVLAV